MKEGQQDVLSFGLSIYLVCQIKRKWKRLEDHRLVEIQVTTLQNLYKVWLKVLKIFNLKSFKVRNVLEFDHNNMFDFQ